MGQGKNLKKCIIYLFEEIIVAKLTNCKTCKKEVSNKAKICPHCGEKLKSGLLKKIIIGSVLVFILLVFIGIFAEKSEHDSAQQASSSQSLEPKVQKQVLTYTVQQLNAMYEENEVKTDEDLKGKTIIITGVVQEISKDFTDGIEVSLVSENKYMPSQMFMEDSEKTAAINLRKGNEVKLHCNSIKYVIKNTTGYKCVFIN